MLRHAAVLLLIVGSLVATLPASAQPAMSAAGQCGSVLLPAAGWLGGKGVDVMSNGRFQGTGKRCDTSLSKVGPVNAGQKWQCVELVNRLYLTRGWISSAWIGNGGRLFKNAPSNLVKQANGSITSLSPGDIVSIRERHNGKFEHYGHAAIVNVAQTVNSGTIPLVSQNAGSKERVIITTNATLSNGHLTLPAGGGWSHAVIGVVHAPTTP